MVYAYLWLAGNEGMDKKHGNYEIMGYIRFRVSLEEMYIKEDERAAKVKGSGAEIKQGVSLLGLGIASSGNLRVSLLGLGIASSALCTHFLPQYCHKRLPSRCLHK